MSAWDSHPAPGTAWVRLNLVFAPDLEDAVTEAVERIASQQQRFETKDGKKVRVAVKSGETISG